MDELSAAIEAAAAAAAASSQSPPKSPDVKLEIKHEPTSPDIPPSSPLKRARSPLDDIAQSEVKRQKLDNEVTVPSSEQPSQAEIQGDPQSAPEIDPQSMPDPQSKVELLGETHLEPTSHPIPNPLSENRAEQVSKPVVDMVEVADSLADGMADLDEITKMIQAAQAAAMGPESVVEDQPMTDFHANINGADGDHGHDIDIGSIMASITSSLESGANGHDHANLSNEMSNEPLPIPDLPAPTSAPSKRTTIWSNRAQYTRQTHILPTLGRVAVDILVALSDQALEETITSLNDSELPIGKEYGVLRAFFDSIRKLLSEDYPLLYPDQLDISSPEDREIIRIANLATSCASMFGANELGWPDLNANFLTTFVACGQQMPTEEANLYLGLKTQMFLTLLESEQTKSRAQILEELFVNGQEDALKKHHPDLPLGLSESKFLADAEARKAMLLNESQDANSIQALSTQYTYEAFLEDLSEYLDKHMSNIEKLGSSPTSVSPDTDSTALFDGVSGLDNFDIDAAIAEAAKAAQEAGSNNGASSSVPDDLAALISFASEQAQGQSGPSDLPSAVLSTSESVIRGTNGTMQTMQRNQYHTTVQQNSTPSSNPQHSAHQSQQAHQSPQQQQYYPYPQQTNGNAHQAQNSDRVELPPGQHASSEVLYERARQAAAARSSTHARREGSHSTRRPWSPEEEKALMMGLDMVKGPHWSQILSLFGQNGRMSNILADRTQVQLKDKARNLKLFFLKTNSEMPYYLQCVTGELKTRAPTQAARKEAEERARLTSEDEKAHVSATMALGNMHNGSGQRAQPKPAPPKSATPGQTVGPGQSQPGSPHTSQLQKTPSSHPPVAISAQPQVQSGNSAQGVPKIQVPVQNQQHAQHVQQVAPRPPQQPAGHVPLKPHQQQQPSQKQSAMQSHSVQPHGSLHQPLQSQQRQTAPHQNQASSQQQQQHQKQIQPQPQHHHQTQAQPPQQQQQQQQQQQSQTQTHQQRSPLQIQPQPQTQPRPQSQSQPHSQAQSQSQQRVQISVAPTQPKVEPVIKHEPHNEEEAGLLELQRFMSQENNAEQEQSIEAALAAASAAAAAAVAAQPAT